MGMTMAEKILARHADKEAVKPGELISLGWILTLANDITAPLLFGPFTRPEEGRAFFFFDSGRIALVMGSLHPEQGHCLCRAGS